MNSIGVVAIQGVNCYGCLIALYNPDCRCKYAVTVITDVLWMYLGNLAERLVMIPTFQHSFNYHYLGMQKVAKRSSGVAVK